MIWTLRTFFELLEPSERRGFLRISGLMLITGLFDLAGVAMILPFLGVLADPGLIERVPALAGAHEAMGAPSHNAFLRILGLATFALVMAAVGMRVLAFYRATVFTRGLNVSLGTRRLERYLAQPYEWFLGRHSADLSRAVLQEVAEIVRNSAASALRVVANGWQIVLLTGLLLTIEPLGAIAIGLLLGVSLGGAERATRGGLETMGHGRRLANRERFQAAGEALGGIKEIKTMGLEGVYLDRYVAPSRRLAGYQARLVLIGELPRFVLEIVTFGGMILLTLYLLWAHEGAVERVVPVLGALAFAALRLMPTSQMLFRDIAAMRYGRAGLAELRDDMRLPESAPALGAAAAPRLTRALDLRGAGYAYPTAERLAVEGIDLRIEAGTAVAICGASGAGKSTVLDLVLGLVAPTVGTLEIDGAPLDAPARRAWTRRVGYVPQSIFLVDDTVAANVAYGVDPARIDRARLAEALRLARLDGVVAALPEGADTFLGDRGTRLSGGQRQRIGIARALYVEADMLVFDEATSALDPATEAETLAAIRGLHGRRTMAVVTHRIATLDWVDQIVLMEDGRIAARGSYRDLEENSPAFRALRDGRARA